jgi:acyl-CoA synthetase (AMP-forming)/AMP-acid ligase II
VGRLATRGRVPIGYYNDRAGSERAFVEIAGQRWSLPGDMATIDADGTVHLIGRGSQCINTGGEKVYPAEVEAVLVEHPAVEDVVVVGAPDARWGECVTAVISPRDPDHPPDLVTLQAHCRRRLAGYKLPRRFRIVGAVRRTSAGKADYAWAAAVARSVADASLT